ncbi:TPA: hypothetical protein DIV49_01410, partial [Candidatus Saccharibacteria bacterium]|nr:hypothetical protein [Candidatus Saccharibacteria bacterium]
LSLFFNDTATTEIYTLPLHDALPISKLEVRVEQRRMDANARHQRATITRIRHQKVDCAHMPALLEHHHQRQKAQHLGRIAGGDRHAENLHR